MPWTTGFCIVGAASIAAFPLFSGFVSKSMILSAAGHEGHVVAFLVLLFASAAMFHPDAKVPFFAFFGRDSGKRCAEAPWNMLVAMGLAAALCIAIGVFPQPLYAMLPFPVDYEPYTGSHLLSQLQLLMFSGLVFAVLLRAGLYPRQMPSVNLDFDWSYRRLAPAVVRSISAALAAVQNLLARGWSRLSQALVTAVRRLHQPGGLLARTWPSGTSALWMMVLLLGLLLSGYLA
jgi:multicomponent Na+:H+ antiporter subunit D